MADPVERQSTHPPTTTQFLHASLRPISPNALVNAWQNTPPCLQNSLVTHVELLSLFDLLHASVSFQDMHPGLESRPLVKFCDVMLLSLHPKI